VVSSEASTDITTNIPTRPIRLTEIKTITSVLKPRQTLPQIFPLVLSDLQRVFISVSLIGRVGIFVVMSVEASELTLLFLSQ
jgi:hypothetical protein